MFPMFFGRFRLKKNSPIALYNVAKMRENSMMIFKPIRCTTQLFTSIPIKGFLQVGYTVIPYN